jgi:hypothetical protein
MPLAESRLLGGKQRATGKSDGKKRRERSGGKKGWEEAVAYGKRALGVRYELPRAAGVLDRVLPHRGRDGSAGSFIMFAPAPAGF